MRKHRFFWQEDLVLNQELVLDQELSHYILHVLRLNVDDLIYLFNNTNIEYAARILNTERKKVCVVITKQQNNSLESPLQINLGQVMCKGDKIDLVLQKATELGVHSITPLYSEYSQIKLSAERANTKIEHWQKIVNAACCQSGRNLVPKVHPVQHVLEWIKLNADPSKLILSPSPTAPRLSAVKITNPTSILIGPEGGFSDAELNIALQHNFLQVGLGPRILRAETAGLAVIAILQALHGDL